MSRTGGQSSPRDIAAGALFVVIGCAFGWFAQDHDLGTPNRMGPAFFPTVLAVMLTMLGTVILVQGLRRAGEPIGRWPWRAILLVLGPGILFGLTIRPLGMIAAVPLLVGLSALASRQVTAAGLILSALALTLFSIAVFAYGLGLPIPVFGRLLGG
ncbi:tripartite tricarboxylate transporter TctB family protein [Geminicoccus flavidas]|uniref:tripartite tricarboxylate transporter TctB family protein n=1 Tax=Geminicoccus flavidas TaxID=2506407 RepID=UPI0013583FE2|nr:tripartite tricarboxylate transporter TctB family protein [Geminicoccus flavidas]